MSVVAALGGLGLPVSGRIAAALRRAVATAADLRDATDLGAMIGTVIPEATLVDLATRALGSASPSLRTRGCALRAYLGPDAAAPIAEAAALTDEPDPVIVAQLRDYGLGSPVA